MPILEIIDIPQLLNIINKNKYVVIFFYTLFNIECDKFKMAFNNVVSNPNYRNIIFCQANVEKIPKIAYLLDLNIYDTPSIIMWRSGTRYKIENIRIPNFGDAMVDMFW